MDSKPSLSVRLKEWWKKPVNRFIFLRVLIFIFNLFLVGLGVLYVVLKLREKLE